MAEYIEKYAVVNRLVDLENEFQHYKPFHGFEHAMYRKICEAEIAIGKTPAADVAPVRHAVVIDKIVNDNETIKPWEYRYYCSACKFPMRDSWNKYCPNCGAKMDLEG